MLHAGSDISSAGTYDARCRDASIAPVTTSSDTNMRSHERSGSRATLLVNEPVSDWNARPSVPRSKRGRQRSTAVALVTSWAVRGDSCSTSSESAMGFDQLLL